MVQPRNEQIETLATIGPSVSGSSLTTLTNGSNADSLHIHNGLITSPDQTKINSLYTGSESATATTTALRHAGGRLTVGEPSATTDAVTKGYIDGRIPSVFPTIAVDATGTDELATIQAAIDAATASYSADGVIRTVQLSAGRHKVSAKPVLKNGVTLEGVGIDATFLEPTATWTPLVADAMSETNVLLDAVGTLDTATCNTVLTDTITPSAVDYYGSGATKISVADSGTLAPDDYIRIGGHSELIGLSPGGSNGPKVDHWEIRKVLSIAANGIDTTLTLATPLLCYHETGVGGAGGKTPRSVVRVIPLEKASVKNLTLSAINGTHAVGLRIREALNVNICNVKVEGFSRNGIEVSYGTEGYVLAQIEKGEQCQTAIRVRHAHGGAIPNFWTNPDVAERSHANGLPCAAIIFEMFSVNCAVTNPRISHVIQGISIRGGHGITIRGGYIHDCDLREQSLVDASGYMGAAIRGSGFCSGSGEGDYDEFVGSWILEGVVFDDCLIDRSTAFDGTCPVAATVCVHDSHNIKVKDITIRVTGRNDTDSDVDTDIDIFGIVSQDAAGTISGVEMKGGDYVLTHRSAAGMLYERFRWTPSPGVGTGSTIFIYLYSDDSPNNVFRDFHGSGYIVTDAAFALNGYLRFDGNWNLNDSNVSGPLKLGLNNTGGTVSMGEQVAVDQTQSDLTLIDITADTTEQIGSIITALGAPNGWHVLFKESGAAGTVVLCTGEVFPGQTLSVTAATATASVGTTRSTYKALSYKAAPGSGLVYAAPMPSPILSISAAADANTIALRGASGELVASSFNTSGTIATTGVLRTAKGVVQVAARNKDNDGNITLVSTELVNNSANFGMDETGTYSAQYSKLGAVGYVLMDGGSQVYGAIGGSIKSTLTSTSQDFSVAIQTDAINEHTAASGVTVDGLLIKDSRLDAAKWREHIISWEFDDGAAGTNIAEKLIGIPHQTCTVTSCRITLLDSITGDDTNYATFTVYGRKTDATQESIASDNTKVASGGVTAFISKSLGTITNASRQTDSSITFEIIKSGGGARCRGVVTVIVTTD